MSDLVSVSVYVSHSGQISIWSLVEILEFDLELRELLE